jgi:hypothetical protein
VERLELFDWDAMFGKVIIKSKKRELLDDLPAFLKVYFAGSSHNASRGKDCGEADVLQIEEYAAFEEVAERG